MVLHKLASEIHTLINNISSKKTLPNDIIESITNILIESDFDSIIIDKIISDIQKVLSKKYHSYSVMISKFKRILYDVLCITMKNKIHINYSKQYTFFIGLQGSGKTTTVAKYAQFLKKINIHKNILIVCLDTYRAGAYDQLRQNANRLNIDFWGDKTEFDPVEIIKKTILLYDSVYDYIIFDTSGRNYQDINLSLELKQMMRCFDNKDNISLVLICDGTHNCKTIEKHISEYEHIDFCIITKLDICDGGGPISICIKLGIPISHMSMGEHLYNFFKYDSSEIARKIVGIKNKKKFDKFIKHNMNDKLFKRIINNEYTLRDYRFQCEQFIAHIDMYGGLLPIPPNMKVTIQSHIVIMKSMTALELDTHEYLKLFKISQRQKSIISSRAKRIIIGSGKNSLDITTFFTMIKRFETMFKTVDIAKTIKKMNSIF